MMVFIVDGDETTRRCVAGRDGRDDDQGATERHDDTLGRVERFAAARSDDDMRSEIPCQFRKAIDLGARTFAAERKLDDFATGFTQSLADFAELGLYDRVGDDCHACAFGNRIDAFGKAGKRAGSLYVDMRETRDPDVTHVPVLCRVLGDLAGLAVGEGNFSHAQAVDCFA